MAISLDAYAVKVRRDVFAVMDGWLEKKTAGMDPGLRGCITAYPRRRGKALRSVLLCLFAGGLGGSYRKASRLAAAYELLENWGLGRDDLMDHAETRRGGPALHRLCGEEAAINALDLTATYIPEMLYGNCLLGPREFGPVFGEFYTAVRRALQGQHLELVWRGRPPREFSPRAYFRLADMKTSSYTTTGPCRLAAVLAGRYDLFGAINVFGRHLGAAFQLMDDVLDLENDGGTGFGKAPGNDIREGKRTLLLWHALRRSSSVGRSFLLRLYSRPPGTVPREADVTRAREAMIASGAAAYCRSTAAARTGSAMAVLERALLPAMNGGYGEALKAFVRRLAGRAS